MYSSFRKQGLINLSIVKSDHWWANRQPRISQYQQIRNWLGAIAHRSWLWFFIWFNGKNWSNDLDFFKYCLWQEAINQSVKVWAWHCSSSPLMKFKTNNVLSHPTYHPYKRLTIAHHQKGIYTETALKIYIFFILLDGLIKNIFYWNILEKIYPLKIH